MESENNLEQVQVAGEVEENKTPAPKKRTGGSKKKKDPQGGKKVKASKAKVEVEEEAKVPEEPSIKPKKTTKATAKKRVYKKKVKAEAMDETDGVMSTPASLIMPDRVRVTVKSKTGSDSPAITPERVAGVSEEVVQDFQGAQVQVGSTRTGNLRVEAAQSITVLQNRALKVRNIDGKIHSVTVDVINDKVIIQGLVHLQIFFVMDDNIVHHLGEDIPFSTFIDVPGATPDVNVQVHPRIEAILHQLSDDGLTLQKRIVIEIFVKVSQFTQVSPEVGNGPLMLLPRVVGEGTKQTLVENIFDLAVPAVKVSEIQGSLRDIVVDVIPDKVIIQGILHKQIFFVDTDNLARHQGEDVHFSLFIDVPGATPGNDVQVHPRIEGIFFELISATQLRQKVVIEVFVKVTDQVQENVVIGDGPLFKVEQVIGEESKQILKENVIELDVPAEKIREIVGEVRNASAEVINDKVIVQGILHKQIFFIGKNDAIEHHMGEDIPFSLFVDLPGATPGNNAHVRFIIEQILFHLEGDQTLRQKAVIRADVVVTETVQVGLILTTGPLFKLEQVIGEGIKQVLITRRQPIAPVPPFPVANVVEITIIQPEQVCVTQQMIVESLLELPEQAIKIREVRGEVVGLRARVIPNDGVLVEGFVNKEVFFVGMDNVVRTIDERIPFSLLVPFPDITEDTPVTARVDIETILFTLDPTGRQVRQVIVLRAEVCEEGQGQPITVVSQVTGEGIVTETVEVRVDLFDPATGNILRNQVVPVVINVSGPRVLRVEKTRLLLDVVNDNNPNPVPLDVVTRVELAPTPLN